MTSVVGVGTLRGGSEKTERLALFGFRQVIDQIKDQFKTFKRNPDWQGPDLRAYLAIRPNFKSKVNIHNCRYTWRECQAPESSLTGEPLFSINVYEAFKINFQANRSPKSTMKE